MAAVQAVDQPTAQDMIRAFVLLLLVAGFTVGIVSQPTAQTTGATLLWFICFVAFTILITRNHGEGTAMLDIATLATGSPVKVNRIVGTSTSTRDAIFLGSNGKGATVQISAPIDAVVTIRHDDTNAWLEDPKTGRTFGRIEDDPVLASSAAELE